MKASIVIAILDSHEIVRRQLIHFTKMNLPHDVQIIFVDDGSNPPLDPGVNGLQNFTLHRTNDFRPWTQPLARNAGAKLANGDFLICTDIDHILTRSLIDFVLTAPADVIHFRRQVAILDENGNFSRDRSVLASWGLTPDRLNRLELRIPPHSNSYAIRRDLFLTLGGSRKLDTYPNRDEIPLKRKIKDLAKLGEITIVDDDRRPIIYMMPNGRFCGDRDFNPFGLFHGLKRR